jgi:quercetin dioxygenase-like cupin family protein
MNHRSFVAVLAACIIAATAAPAAAKDLSGNASPRAPQAPVPEAPAQAKTDYPAVSLLSTGTTIVGETIRYPKGPAHVTAAIVTLAPGGRTIMHKHGVPLFAYILEGELTVAYGKHGTRTYRQGQSLMEAMNVAHFGINNGSQPVRLLAVYMGSTRAKDVIPVK